MFTTNYVEKRAIPPFLLPLLALAITMPLTTQDGDGATASPLARFEVLGHLSMMTPHMRRQRWIVNHISNWAWWHCICYVSIKIGLLPTHSRNALLWCYSPTLASSLSRSSHRLWKKNCDEQFFFLLEEYIPRRSSQHRLTVGTL